MLPRSSGFTVKQMPLRITIEALRTIVRPATTSARRWQAQSFAVTLHRTREKVSRARLVCPLR